MQKKLSLANFYDRVYDGESVTPQDFVMRGWPKNRHEVLVWLSGSGQRVLDVGCGNGIVLYQLRTSFEELCGVELSKVRVESSQKLLRGSPAQVDIRQGNIEEGLDWPDGYFDLVISADVIEHVVDIWSAAQEMVRLLRPGGTLICSTPNFAYIRWRLKLLFGLFPSTGGGGQGFDVRPGELYDGGHLHYFTFTTLERLFLRYNVEIVRRVGFGRLGRLHNLIPSLLSSAACIVGKKAGLHEHWN